MGCGLEGIVEAQRNSREYVQTKRRKAFKDPNLGSEKKSTIIRAGYAPVAGGKGRQIKYVKRSIE